MFLNKVFLYGNLTKDPELKTLPSGSNVVNFSIATNRVYKDKDGAKQEAVEFHNIVAFARTADIISQYMKKGRPIFVEGRITTRSWEGKEDGKKQYRTEIIVENFQFGADGGAAGGGKNASYGSDNNAGGGMGDMGGESGGNSGGGNSREKNSEGIKYPDEEINPEDIPF